MMLRDDLCRSGEPMGITDRGSTAGKAMLVTGGAGFLGRHLARLHAEMGWQVTVFDDLSCTNSSFDCPELQHPLLKCIHGSMFDELKVRTLVAAHPVVVHFASVVGVGKTIDNPVETARNLTGTLALAGALTRHHTVLFGSSADVYGMHSLLHERPMREEDHVVFEHAGVNRWVYPKVKALEENVIGAAAARSVNVRIFNTYGPWMDYPDAKRAIPQLIRALAQGEPMRLNGEGAQRRCFCWYEDMIDGLSRAVSYAEKRETGWTGTINLGNDRAISIKALAQLINRLGVELKLPSAPVPIIDRAQGFYSQAFCDDWHRMPDLSRAREMLRFDCRVDLEEGLRRVLTAWRDGIGAVSERATLRDASGHALSTD
jgi:UDP-glucose 4-epimerase